MWRRGDIQRAIRARALAWAAGLALSSCLGGPDASRCAAVQCLGGQACDPVDGLCKNDLCAGVSCPAAPDRCHQPGTCDPANGRCSAATVKTCPEGQTCDLADGKCGSSLSCTQGVCTASDLCHLPGSCDGASGRCSPQTLKPCPAGQTCDLADGRCKGSDLCAGVICPPASDPCHVAGSCDPASGLCKSQTAVSCAPGLACDPADGTCETLDPCAGVTCPPPSGPCLVPGSCDPATGFCSPEKAKTCPGTQTCDPADDTCKDSLCARVICPPPGDLCHLAGTCDPGTGLCSAQTAKPCPPGQRCDLADGQCKASNPCDGVTCPGGQTCDPADGVCKGPLIPAPQVAKQLGVFAPLAGIAMLPTGATFVAGSLSQTRSFDGISVSPAGDSDVLVVRYDPGTRKAVWARSYGDAAAQTGQDVAVTGDGTVAVIGSFTGSMTFGSSTITSSSTIDFLAGVDGSSGAGSWARQFNNGGGQLVAVAANPALDRIAVCGFTDRASTDLVPGAVYGGGSRDLVIALFDSAGNRIWSAQAGGPGNEDCGALAIDDTGDVYAAGRFDGASLVFPGGTIALSGPNSTIRKFLWIARFAAAGSGGAASTISAAAFSGTTGQTSAVSLTADSTGQVVVAGNFTGAGLAFGSSTLSSAGGQDAFVASLDPGAAAPFQPRWAVRLGGTANDAANRVAVDSSGDATVVGFFNRTTTGAAALTANGTGADVFVLKLSGTTGQTQFATGYGDPNPQTGDRIAVNRLGTGAVKDLPVFAGTFSGTVDFGPPAGALTISTSDVQVFLVFALFTH